MDDFPSTIKHPDAFISSLPPGHDGIFDWSFLLPIFEGTNIQPTDIDALVERFGRILILETKQPGKDVPLGQRKALETLLKLGRGNICVMVIYGKTDSAIVALEEWHYKKECIRMVPKKPCDFTHVIDRVAAWFKWANKRP